MTRPRDDAKAAADPPGLFQRIKLAVGRTVPGRETLANHPMLKPVAQHLLGPHLWHMQHEAVARGVAIGAFWAFALPFGQVLAAAAHCVWWRANIPVAAVITLITNPFTVGFWLWLAYETGSLIVDAPPFVMPGHGVPFREWLMMVGEPVVLGMGIFALGGAVAGYLLVKLGWRLHLAWRQWRRAHARGARKPRQSNP